MSGIHTGAKANSGASERSAASGGVLAAEEAAGGDRSVGRGGVGTRKPWLLVRLTRSKSDRRVIPRLPGPFLPIAARR